MAPSLYTQAISYNLLSLRGVETLAQQEASDDREASLWEAISINVHTREAASPEL